MMTAPSPYGHLEDALIRQEDLITRLRAQVAQSNTLVAWQDGRIQELEQDLQVFTKDAKPKVSDVAAKPLPRPVTPVTAVPSSAPPDPDFDTQSAASAQRSALSGASGRQSPGSEHSAPAAATQTSLWTFGGSVESGAAPAPAQTALATAPPPPGPARADPAELAPSRPVLTPVATTPGYGFLRPVGSPRAVLTPTYAPPMPPTDGPAIQSSVLTPASAAHVPTGHRQAYLLANAHRSPTPDPPQPPKGEADGASEVSMQRVDESLARHEALIAELQSKLGSGHEGSDAPLMIEGQQQQSHEQGRLTTGSRVTPAQGQDTTIFAM